jgi:Na+-transporting NADH:ubiquinone oxidoreductase subunit B
MKLLKRFFDTQRPHFEPGGRLAQYLPLFEAIETVFFTPAEVSPGGPHVRDNLDVKRFMTLVIVMLLPHLFFGMYNTGYQALLAAGREPQLVNCLFIGLTYVIPLVLVTYAVGFAWEVLFAVIRGHGMSEGLFVTCMLFPLTLPPTTPLWQVALGVSFGIVIGKEIFGGTGRNFLNPALTGRAFLFFAFPVRMSGDAVWTAEAVWRTVSAGADKAVDAVTAATPLAVAALTATGSPIQVALHEAGYGFWKLFWGLYPGSVGGTATWLCLMGAVALCIMGIANYRIVVGGILGILCTGVIFNLVAKEGGNPWLGLNPFYHLVMGGFAFALAYMATEPVSGPDMDAARWVYGFLIGALTLLIRVFNPAFPEGAMLAVLFMNLFAPLMDHVVVQARLRKRMINV